jgi:hypothetical protein
MPDGKSLSKNGVALAVAHSRYRIRSLSPAAMSEALVVMRAALDRAVSGIGVHACVRLLLDRARRQALFKEALAEITLQLTSALETSADGGLAGVPEARHSFSRAAAASAMAELLLQCTKTAVDDAALKCVPLVEAASAALAADKAIFAAAVCVGRWGELLTVRAEAEGAAHDANAALEAERGLAARAATTIDAMRV